MLLLKACCPDSPWLGGVQSSRKQGSGIYVLEAIFPSRSRVLQLQTTRLDVSQDASGARGPDCKVFRLEVLFEVAFVVMSQV